MKTIERFYEEEPIDAEVFFNGKYDFWHSMPAMYRDKRVTPYVLNIDFENEEEIIEFYRLIKFKEKWGGKKDILPLNATGFRVRFPNNLIEKTRNSNYRFVHEETARLHPELYEIVSLENLHYEDER